MVIRFQVVIIQPIDSGNKSHPYGHALVAGIERYPSKITRRMSKARQEKRSKIKPFIKAVNYNHLMPTRYTLELEGLKGSVTPDTFKEVSQREDAKKTVKKTLEERYTSGKNRWFFTPLRMCLPIPRVCRSIRRDNPHVLWNSILRGTMANDHPYNRFLNMVSSSCWAGRMVLGCIHRQIGNRPNKRWL
jgi:large subunit ribosomal protein L27e